MLVYASPVAARVQHRMERAKLDQGGRTVYNSYEIDENTSETSASTWMQIDNLDDRSTSEYVSRWAVAIQYSYSFEGEIYAKTYFLPETWSE